MVCHVRVAYGAQLVSRASSLGLERALAIFGPSAMLLAWCGRHNALRYLDGVVNNGCNACCSRDLITAQSQKGTVSRAQRHPGLPVLLGFVVVVEDS